MHTVDVAVRLTEKLSKDIKTSLLVERWVWSRLCGFPQICEPGGKQSVDYRRIYKRAGELFDLDTSVVRRAAERLGVYSGRENYYDTDLYLKPYKRGWRVKDSGWASVRNPAWRDNRNFDKGIYRWGRGVREADRAEAREKIRENILKYNRSGSFYGDGTDSFDLTCNREEFLIKRPEVYLRGVSETSVAGQVRRKLIETLVPIMKIDDRDPNGRDLFYPQEIDDIYYEMNEHRLQTGSSLILREKFYQACRLFLITSWMDYKHKEPYKKTHGLRVFLDVVDQAKIKILVRLPERLSQEFEVFDVWREFRCDDLGEKLIYDSALAELVYEGFLRTKAREYGVNSKGYKTWLDNYALAEGSGHIDVRRLYFHTLNPYGKQLFKEQRPKHYAEYIGQKDVWEKWA